MIKVLFLIDDDQDDREIFREALAIYDPGIEFLCAGDGVEALNTLDSLKDMPDAIFVDNYMPRMNGVDFLKALKLSSKTRLILTVIYSTSVDSEKEKIMLLSGADYYLQKHSTFTELCSELVAMLEKIKGRLASRRNERA
jgi:DNA-binding response OmpR family regulator